MQTKLLVVLALFLAQSAFAQHRFPRQVFSINGFRNPSIGLEYQRGFVSVHAGYYPTNFSSGVTTEFLRAGLSVFFLPVDRKPIPSSFYAGASYARGMTRDYKGTDALAVEAGFRWFAWKGLNLRLGVVALGASGKGVKVNPTPGISYSFSF